MTTKQIFSGLKFANLASIGLLLTRKKSLRRYLNQNKIAYFNEKQIGIPMKPFYEIFPECIEINETINLISEPTTGGLSKTELYYLSTIVKYFQPKQVFEIGTFDGCASAHIALNIKRPDSSKILTLDLPPDRERHSVNFSDQEMEFLDVIRPGYYLKKYDKLEVVNQLYGDSLYFDFSPYYGKMDLIFTDGNHNQPFIESDTKNAFLMLNKNGIIIWHDYYGIPGKQVSDYLIKLSNDYTIFRIKDTSFAVYRRG